VFPGRLERSRLDRWERLLTRVVRAREGDARDWGAVRTWGTGIGADLAAAVAGT
jgi:menaquinone-dependent protoporphyrinogen oxidase